MKTQIRNWTLAGSLLILSMCVQAGDRTVPDQISRSQNSSLTEPAQIPNSQIDPIAFLSTAQKAIELRAKRRLTEEEFIRLSREKGVIVLDARSKNRYDQLHIQGAISLPFTDFTFDSLKEALPDKSVKILIYCNNNFRGNVPEFAMKSAGSALNLSTFSSLYEYGYHNVYELGPELDLDKTKLTLVGNNANRLIVGRNKR